MVFFVRKCNKNVIKEIYLEKSQLKKLKKINFKKVAFATEKIKL